jgi:uncharacterized membrane protein (UPF0127 family)
LNDKRYEKGNPLMKKAIQATFKVSALGFALFLSGFSCHSTLKSDLPVVPLKISGHEILVEVANRVATRDSGLMFRQEMGGDNGMLFVFPDTDQRYFWMKNTVIPLSIAYMDEKGAILNILEMPPETEKSFPSNGPARFALEMNKGWFAKQGIKPGDVVEGVLNAPKAQE